jgi:hypothetical protein
MVDTLLGIQFFNCQPYLTTSVLLRFEVSSTLLYPVYCLKQYSKNAMNKEFGLQSEDTRFESLIEIL